MRTCGLKVYIMLDAAVEVKKEFKEVVVAAGDPEFSIVFRSQPEETKKTRKLVKDEDREMGRQVVNL